MTIIHMVNRVKIHGKEKALTRPEEPCLSKKHSSAEDEKENVDDKGKKPMREEDLPQEKAEADEEAADSPGSRTDMELAWENLEVAKYIYEHEPEGNHAKELAGNWRKGQQT